MLEAVETKASAWQGGHRGGALSPRSVSRCAGGAPLPERGFPPLGDHPDGVLSATRCGCATGSPPGPTLPSWGRKAPAAKGSSNQKPKLKLPERCSCWEPAGVPGGRAPPGKGASSTNSRLGRALGAARAPRAGARGPRAAAVPALPAGPVSRPRAAG